MSGGRKVVVVAESATQRAQLVRALQADDDVTVVGEAGTAAAAISSVASVRPDAVVLDLQVPDAQRIVEHLMTHTPTPILVLASGRDSADAGAALVAGAVDVLPRPERWTDETERTLRSSVRIVAGVAVIRHRSASVPPPRPSEPVDGITMIGIGASTGGPAALGEVLAGLGGVRAAVLVVQHLHDDFVESLVTWMDRVSPLQVQLVVSGERPRPGVAYIAPGGLHLRVAADDTLSLDPEPESLHRPSVDVLFTSLAERRRGRNVGVLLTGMGDDGARGLLAMRRRGDVTIAQDEATSVVYGMPKAAQRLGAAAEIVPLDKVAAAVQRSVSR